MVDVVSPNVKEILDVQSRRGHNKSKSLPSPRGLDKVKSRNLTDSMNSRDILAAKCFLESVLSVK